MQVQEFPHRHCCVSSALIHIPVDNERLISATRRAETRGQPSRRHYCLPMVMTTITRPRPTSVPATSRATEGRRAGRPGPTATRRRRPGRRPSTRRRSSSALSWSTLAALGIVLHRGGHQQERADQPAQGPRRPGHATCHQCLGLLGRQRQQRGRLLVPGQLHVRRPHVQRVAARVLASTRQATAIDGVCRSADPTLLSTGRHRGRGTLVGERVHPPRRAPRRGRAPRRRPLAAAQPAPTCRNAGRDGLVLRSAACNACSHGRGPGTVALRAREGGTVTPAARLLELLLEPVGAHQVPGADQNERDGEPH